MKNLLAIAAAAGCMLMSSASSASLITYTFTADGVTDTTAQQGTAVFTFDTADLSSFTITLTDNVSPTALIASELDGFEFSFSQTPTAMQLTSVAPVSVINCNQSQDPCPAGSGSSPFGWGSTLNGADAAFGAGFNSGTGTFSYHPYAIVNANYDAPGGNGGLSNDQHNPLLVGPVTFTFSLAGLTSVPEISSVTFLFGTVPDAQPGQGCTDGNCQPDLQVPEPNTLALLGVALVSIAWIFRRRQRDQK